MPHATNPQHSAALSGAEFDPAKLTLGVLHRVLQRLLNVDLPTRDLVLILEAIAEAAEQRADAIAGTREVA